jgi:ABC-type Na+ transport system ATPase subunit NatA
MPTITPPKRQVTVTKSDITLTRSNQDEIGRLLGLDRAGRATTLNALQGLLSENQALLRGAPLAPQRAHQVSAHTLVQKDAARLYKTITSLPDHHRQNLPDVEKFVSQLAEFHDQVQIGLIQMKGRGSQRGGGKKRGVAMARKVAEHSIGVFFDLNALGTDGKLRTDGLTVPAYAIERKHFVEYCMDLISPLAA